MTSVFDDILGRIDGLNRTFVLGPDKKTFGDLLSSANGISKSLKQCGLENSDRVGICIDQSFAYTAAILGIRQACGIPVLMAPDWTEEEKTNIIKLAETRLIISDEPIKGTTHVKSLTSIVGDETSIYENAIDSKIQAQPDDAIIIFSSGTTGVSKGIVLTDTGLSENIRAVASYLHLTEDDSSPIFTPPCYAYSVSQHLTHAWAGASVFPVGSGLKFPIAIPKAIEKYRLTGVSANPTAFKIIGQIKTIKAMDLSSVRYLMTGGQPLSNDLVSMLKSNFTNTEIINMYGCTENSPRISYHYINGKSGMDDTGYFSVGTAVHGTEITVITENGTPAKPGETGEIRITGTSLMRKYWNKPEETEVAFSDGWLHTADIGYFDKKGLLYLCGRQSNVINTSNQKVSPEEVEKVLIQHEDIVDAGVYGRKNPLFGELVVADIVLRPESDMDIINVQGFCRLLLSSYKIPREINFVDTLPLTLYGKIDRKRLGR